MEQFTLDDLKVVNRVDVLQQLVSEQKFADKPCPLLASQLNTTLVLCERLTADLNKLLGIVKNAGYPVRP